MIQLSESVRRLTESRELRSSMKASGGTVVLVDDDPAIRHEVARLLCAAGYAVQTFSSPVEFLRNELPPGPGCVLLEMEMEGLSGLEVQEVLQQNLRCIPVLFLSGHGTIATATVCIKRGAHDFLEKPVRPKELMEAIRTAIEHDKQLWAARLERNEYTRRYKRLTPRECEVMRLVIAGRLNKQSASELGISEKTIKVHRARVMEKMQVVSVANLVRIAGHIGIGTAAAPGSVARVDRQLTLQRH